MENTLNLVIITLLVIAIIYGMILNYRLSNFKETKKEILKASASFKQISQNTERALTQLQKSTNMMTEQLREYLSRRSFSYSSKEKIIRRGSSFVKGKQFGDCRLKEDKGISH